NGDGTFTTIITLNVENFGQVDLGDIQVTDDLSAFGTHVTLANLDAADEYTVSNLLITSNSADPLSVNGGFNGDGDIELLNVVAGGTLAIGETVTISFQLRFYPSQDAYLNQAIASGDVPANDDPTGNPDNDPDDTTDDSTDGTDPDPNDDDDPEEDVPTPIDPDDSPVANDDTANTDQDVAINIDPLPNDDFGTDGPNNGSISILVPPTNGTAVVDNNGTPTDPTDDTIDYTPDPGFSGTDQITYQICDSDGDCDDAIITITVNPTAVKLLVKVMLQGALLNSPDNLMRDDLRSRGFIPAEEPYTLLDFAHVNGGGGEVVANPGAVFANNGANSIVDWVFVELRSSVDPEVVVATRAGLVQRDGDVVDIDGLSPLCFEQTLPGTFYVAVRHRNHLGTMTASAIALSSNGTIVDFTNLATPLWENNASFDGFEQITINGIYALWAGNTSVDNKVVFAGQDNDKDPIFNEIDQAPANILKLQTFIFPGYHPGDVDLNGDSIYAGQNNDVDPIFNNVDGHPVNILKLQTFVIPEQIAGN
ncbi:MAG: Ig-like domain-containing protein, partial [Chitinophagales bacterium]|nr:Ig-like domain-containing protein [Chitinophagales bacterium]